MVDGARTGRRRRFRRHPPAALLGRRLLRKVDGVHHLELRPDRQAVSGQEDRHRRNRLAVGRPRQAGLGAVAGLRGGLPAQVLRARRTEGLRLLRHGSLRPAVEGRRRPRRRGRRVLGHARCRRQCEVQSQRSIVVVRRVEDLCGHCRRPDVPDRPRRDGGGAETQRARLLPARRNRRPGRLGRLVHRRRFQPSLHRHGHDRRHDGDRAGGAVYRHLAAD